jgi:hypothetical protein
MKQRFFALECTVASTRGEKLEARVLRSLMTRKRNKGGIPLMLFIDSDDGSEGLGSMNWRGGNI